MKILRLSTLISLLCLPFLHSLLQTVRHNSYPTVIILWPINIMDPIQNFPPHVILAPRRALYTAELHCTNIEVRYFSDACHSDFFRLAKTLLRLYLKLALISNNFRPFSDCYDFLSFFKFKLFSDC